MPYSIFLDLDGTLLPAGSHQISDRTLGALTKAKNDGHRIFLNTGRPPSGLSEDAYRGFPFDGYLCGCSYVKVGGTVILADRLTANELKPIVAHFYGRDIIVLLEGEESVRAAYDQTGESGFLPVNEINEIFRICESEPITKITVRKRLNEEDLAFIRQFADPIPRSDSDCTEVVPRNHSKATVMNLVVDFLALDRETVIAIGDTENDIPMLKAAPLSVAMGNASDEVKKYAKFVTSSAENDGVAEVLEKLLP